MASDSSTTGAGGSDAGDLQRHLRAFGAVVTVVAGAFLIGGLLAGVARGVLAPMGLTAQTPLGYVLINSVQFVGFGLAVAAFLGLHGEWGLVRVRAPTARDLGWAAAGLLALVGMLLASSLVYEFTSLEPAASTLVQFGRGRPVFFLYLLPMTVLLVGPAEELVFRGVVQGTLAREYGPRVALVVASAVFALIHWSSYIGEGRIVTLATIFFLGGLLGYLYQRTDNILVPAAAHGLFNAAQFLYEYAVSTGLL